MSMRLVTISALVFALTGCPGGGAKKPDDGVPDNRPARRAILTWGMSSAAPRAGVPRTDVFLAITEETGKSVSYPVGTYDGTCAIVGPIETYHALTAISCTYNGAGYQLHASGNRDRVVVMKMAIAEGHEPDPFARDQVFEIAIPLGAKIEAGAQ